MIHSQLTDDFDSDNYKAKRRSSKCHSCRRHYTEIYIKLEFPATGLP